MKAMFGIECYSSKHYGFTGRIKELCEDFAVTEIDELGKLVQVIPYQVGPTALISKGYDKRSRTQTCSSSNHKDDHKNELKKNHENHDKNSKEQSRQLYQVEELTALDALKKAQSQLHILLEDGKLTELQEMGDQQAGKAAVCLNLGIFNKKEDRAALHLHTRMAFPSIKTTTVQQNGDYSLTASVDRVHGELMALLQNKEDLDRFMRFAHCTDKTVVASCDLASNDDKVTRTKVHRLIAKHYGSFLESKTFNDSTGGSKCHQSTRIQVRMRAKQTGNKRFKETMQMKRNQEMVFTRFVLMKTNLETLEAIERLSKCLGAYPSAFSYAGIKDRRAVTVQNMTVKGITAEQLVAVREHPSLSGITTGNYSGVATPMRIGQLSGNHFQITIREIELDMDNSSSTTADIVSKAINNVSNHGFVNYFGPQRFGQEDGAVNAFDVGLTMLQGDMVKAVQLLMTPGNLTDPANTAKRYYQETRDIPGTLTRMPFNRTRERLVLKSLHRHGKDNDGCIKALLNIPYPMRLLYVHSYSSLVWNHMATFRLRQHDELAVVKGDLVHDRSAESLTSRLREDVWPHNEELTSERFSKETTAGKSKVGSPSADDIDISESREQVRAKTGIDKSEVRVVTEEDVRSGKYTIRDVLLPLPGYNILYPENQVGNRYNEKLQEDNLSSKNFRLRSLGLGLPGAYRKLLAFPRDLTWQWVGDYHPEGSREIPKDLVESSKCAAMDTVLSKPGTSGDNHVEAIGSSSERVEPEQECSDNILITSEGQHTEGSLEIPKDLVESSECVAMDTVLSYPGTSGSTDNLRGDLLNKSHSTSDCFNSKDSSEAFIGCAIPSKRRKLDQEEELDQRTFSEEKMSHKKLKISFSLESSCYATVCLREIMQT